MRQPKKKPAQKKRVDWRHKFATLRMKTDDLETNLARATIVIEQARAIILDAMTSTVQDLTEDPIVKTKRKRISRQKPKQKPKQK